MIDVIEVFEQTIREALRREKFYGFTLSRFKDRISCYHGGYKASIYWTEEGEERWWLELTPPREGWGFPPCCPIPDTNRMNRYDFDIMVVDADKLIQMIINHLGGIRPSDGGVRTRFAGLR